MNLTRSVGRTRQTNALPLLTVGRRSRSLSGDEAARCRKLACANGPMMSERDGYRRIEWGVEALPARLALPRHRHSAGYANLVLSGTFMEASFSGRFRVEAGDVLLHGSFDCHGNFPIGVRETKILRLPWRSEAVEGKLRVKNPDRLAIIAERDLFGAVQLLESSVERCPTGDDDWPAMLARDISSDSSLKLSAWAEARGLAPESVSRGFAQSFGVSPRQFRMEMRARQA